MPQKPILIIKAPTLLAWMDVASSLAVFLASSAAARSSAASLLDAFSLSSLCALLLNLAHRIVLLVQLLLILSIFLCFFVRHSVGAEGWDALII